MIGHLGESFVCKDCGIVMIEELERRGRHSCLNAVLL